MPYVIRFVGVAGIPGRATPEPGQFLSSYDLDARGGRGEAEWTTHAGEALLFISFEDAWNAWRGQSSVTPLRDDGKPNRPLTAYTIEVMKL